METPPIVTDPAMVDAAWMTAVLRRSGALPEGHVTGIDAKPVGNGLVGDSFRFTLTCDGALDTAPATVIGKFPAADPASRATGAAYSLYLKEVSFYRELSGTVGMITPTAHYAEIDRDTSDFALIFEDFGPARAGDQLDGCSVDDARTALLEAAALHAPWWGKEALTGFAFLTAASDTVPQYLAALPHVVAGFRDRYQGQLETEHDRLLTRLPAAAAAMNAGPSGPLTIQHGDFRLDNILFDIQGGARRMGTLDWQTVGLGYGALDVAYFLSAGLAPDVRRQHEKDLVDLYHAELMRLGVADYALDQCWHDYRRFAVHGVLMGVFSAMAVERTDRGDALFLAMTFGACAQALDHGAFDLWGV